MLIKEMSKGVASNGKPFLTLIFSDHTGQIEAKLWDASKEDESLYIAERIVSLSGEINQFRGRKKLKINTIRLAHKSEGLQVTDFIEKSHVDKKILFEQLNVAIFEIDIITIHRIVYLFINKLHEDF